MRLDLVAAWALSVSCATSAVVADTPSIDVADTQHSAGADTLSLPFTFEHTRATPTDEHLETPEDSRIEFAVPLQGNEYIISAVVSEGDVLDSSCGNLHLSFPSTTGVSSWSGSSEPISVEAWDSRRHGRHTLAVRFASHCPRSRSLPSSVEAVKAEVLSVDYTEFTGPSPDFFITYDHSRHRVDVLSGPYYATETGEDPVSLVEYGSFRIPFLSEDDWGKLRGLRDDNADVETRLQDSDSSLGKTEQIRLIESAIICEESQISQLAGSLERHRKLLNIITDGDYAATKGSFKDCHNWSCVFRSLYKKSKACMHNIYIRIVAFAKPKPHEGEDCSRMASASPATQVQFLSGSFQPSKACSHYERPAFKDYKLISETIKEIESESDSDDISSDTSSTVSVTDEKHSNNTRSAFDQSSAHQSYTITHRTHTILASVLGLLCLSCLATHLHRRCCDPRLQADRAFRREERQARRELRVSAKRQAWKEWWARRLGLGCCMCCRRKDKRVADYEEKRALFRPQEERMEEVMQDEIRYLTGGEAEEGRAYGFPARVPTPAVARQSTYEASESRQSQRRHATRQSRANTGGSQGSNPESLPSYRSRDSSGSRERPPSYRTRASSMGQRPPSTDQDLVSVDPVLAMRLANVFPHVGRRYRGAERISQDGDETPDSSVVDVSPRLSSETLRTERSVV